MSTAEQIVDYILETDVLSRPRDKGRFGGRPQPTKPGFLGRMGRALIGRPFAEDTAWSEWSAWRKSRNAANAQARARRAGRVTQRDEDDMHRFYMDIQRSNHERDAEAAHQHKLKTDPDYVKKHYASKLSTPRMKV